MKCASIHRESACPRRSRGYGVTTRHDVVVLAHRHVPTEQVAKASPDARQLVVRVVTLILLSSLFSTWKYLMSRPMIFYSFR
eukprot:13637552-Heterocapsa_arctica.AAC.1